jgi:hypothetical protein
MASGYSQPGSKYRHLNPVDVFDENLVATVLGSKQQKYDKNLAAIDAAIENYGNIDLARTEDKEYLQQRLQKLTDGINNAGMQDLSSSSVTRNIERHIDQALDDHVMTQAANTATYRKFQEELKTKKEKNPELYNEANVQYAIDKAGLQDWLSGYNKQGEKVDKLGNLEYNDYYDINESLQKDIEGWAKNLGYTKSIDESGNEYFVRIGKNETLSEQKVEDYVRLKIQQDPKLVKQMQINAHSQYRGVSEEEILNSVKERAEAGYLDADRKLSDVRAKIENTNPDNVETIAYLKAHEERYLQEKGEFEKQKSLQSINKEAFANKMYTNDLINNYKDVYAQHNELDVKYQNLASKATNSKVKGADEKSDTTLGMDGAGTIVTQDLHKLDEDAPGGTLTHQETKLDNYLVELNDRMNTLDPAFKTLTPEQQEAKIKSLLSAETNFSINGQIADPDTLNMIAKVKEAQNSIEAVNNDIKATMEPVIDNFYDGLLGGIKKDLDIDNLSHSLPYTAGLLKGNKSFSKLTEEEKNLVRLEMANNMGEHLASDEQKPVLERYKKQLSEGLDTSKLTVKTERPGFWGALGKVALAEINQTINTLDIITPSNPFSTREQFIKNNQEENKAWDEGRETSSKAYSDLANATKNMLRTGFAEDANLSDIDSDDVVLGEFKDHKVLKEALEIATIRANDKLVKEQPNMDEVATITFSNRVEADKPYADQLTNFMRGRGRDVSKDSSFSLYPSEDGRYINVRFSEQVTWQHGKTGRDVTNKPFHSEEKILLTDLQRKFPDLVKLVSKKRSAWELSRDNPNDFSRTISFEPPKDATSRAAMVDKWIRNNQGRMSKKQAQEMLVNPEKFFPSKTEIERNAIRLLDAPTLEKYRNEVLNKEYSMEYKRVQGRGFLPILKSDGEEVLRFPPVEEEYFDYFQFNQKTTAYIKSYLTQQVTNYGTGLQR